MQLMASVMVFLPQDLVSFGYVKSKVRVFWGPVIHTQQQQTFANGRQKCKKRECKTLLKTIDLAFFGMSILAIFTD